MASYLIPKQPVEFEEVIKGSRFITYLAHCDGIEAAKTFVQSIKEKHSDARHNCWAFAAGAPGDSLYFGCSDDGEPSGTAGKPMLAQLAGSGVGEIAAVTTRYFGGTKLGTGGLVKAYGGGVNEALKQLLTVEKIMMVQMQFEVPFVWQSLLESTCQSINATITKRQFSHLLRVDLDCPEAHQQKLMERLVNGSKGQINVIVPN